ncbi:MAG: DNA double-strand break repair nuclease NurA [Euryarchaeota archaeon]|nr:DNA double-strand break repair nuclease NurA [Euryarchaeota archaeon]
MTLDPVHVKEIASLAHQVGRRIDTADHRTTAERAWTDLLDPLVANNRRIMEPVDRQYRKRVTIEDAALCDPPYPINYGLDSGTLNPTTYKNGVVMDAAHAALGCVPTDLERHRSRTIVMTLHLDDPGHSFSTDWRTYDEDASRMRIVDAPAVDRYNEAIVHALSLYLAEGAHARQYVDSINSLLVLDGPIYPKDVLNWQDRDTDLADLLLAEMQPRQVVENYLELVGDFLDRDLPIAGFVKNPSSRAITRALGTKDVPTPWTDDTAFFIHLLEQREGDERVRNELTYTNWFVSRGGTDRTFAAGGDALGFERRHPDEEYEVTFFVIYDPRDDVLYKAEAPYGVTKDEVTREALQTQMLSEVASQRGPPEAVAKADELARISAREKEGLRRMIEGELDTELSRTYDDLRWSGEEAFF